MIFYGKSKNENLLSFGASYCKRVLGGVAHREKNLVFCTKISKNTKNVPNFLKFGLELPYQVLCWAKEAPANI